VKLSDKKTDTREVCGTATALCPQYRVLIHNDDSTPMPFVVGILIEIFKKEQQEALEIMMAAHTGGVALVCVLPLEQAEFRIDQAHSVSRAQKFPLTFTCEPE
jgi:ATP-dependent Clp protease adaptor protein ClpS